MNPVPIAPSLKRSIVLLFVFTAHLWGQHGAHTHGRAELNLVLNSNRELVVELITPAESVYGFEHAPRSAEESEQMNRGLKRLKALLPKLVVFERGLSCATTEIEDVKLTEFSQKHEPHGHTSHVESGHAHHAKDHHGEKRDTHEDHHQNVAVRWRVLCDVDLMGKRIIVNWHDALPDINRVELTLLTPNRQEGVSLRRSGEKIRL